MAVSFGIDARSPRVVVCVDRRDPAGSHRHRRGAGLPRCCAGTRRFGKFVEFYGEGGASRPPANRATLGNMSPDPVPLQRFS